MRYFLFVFFFIGFLFGDNLIKVCYPQNLKPYSYEENGIPKGIAIDYLNLISNNIDLNFKYIKSKDFREHILMNKNNQCDLVPIIIKEPNYYDFLLPTSSYTFDYVALLTKIDKQYVADLSSLHDKKIGINYGYKNVIMIMRKKYPNLNFLPMKYKDAIKKVQNDEIYGYVDGYVVLSYNVFNKYKDKLKIMRTLNDVKVSLSVGVNKNKSYLIPLLNKGINDISIKQRSNIDTSWKNIHNDKIIDYELLTQIIIIFSIIILAVIIIVFQQRKNNLKLKKIQKKLEELNNSLESRVKKEVEKNKQQQLILMQQSRLAQMGEMISMIAHQWRQPLNNISLIIQGAVIKYKRGKINDEYFEQFKIDSKNQIQQMSRTIDDFRDFFKPQKELSSFNLSQSIYQSISILKPVLKKELIFLELSLDESINIMGYPNELGQSLINIINNAKDALEDNNIEKKYIKISLIEEDKNALLTIEDNGCGIKEDLVADIFNPYFSTKLDKNGTGLGLYMTKMIIEEHMHGKVWVNNIDKGVIFTLTFPISSKIHIPQIFV